MLACKSTLMRIDSNQPRIEPIECQLKAWKLGIPPKNL